MIEAAARAAARYAKRLCMIVGYDDDEALQDARIGAWRALPGTAWMEPAAREKRLSLAGYRDVLDARDARWKRSRGGAREQALYALPERDVTDAMERALHEGRDPAQAAAGPSLHAVRDACRAIERLRDPLPNVARWLIEGDSRREIAARLGVSPERVDQHRRTLRQTVARVMGGAWAS